MIAVQVYTVKPTGERSVGYRPVSIAKHPVVWADNATKALYCAVRFNVVTWG